jgi:cytochrome P450
MLRKDPPEHTRLRKLVTGAFAVKRIVNLEPVIQAMVDKCIDRIERQKSFDVVLDVGAPLAAYTVAYILGVPDGDLATFTRWSDAMVTKAVDYSFGLPPEDDVVNNRAREELAAYFADLVARRRASGNASEGDIISHLLHAESEEGRLNAAEVLSMCRVILGGGATTTRHLVSSAMLLLSENPETMEEVRAKPELVPALLEEVLRCCTPLQLAMRYATADTEIRGKHIKKDSAVALWLASANRDEDVFPDSERFDIHRKENEEHIAMSVGPHHCVGANLGRLEARVAVQTMLKRMRHVRRVSDGPVEMEPSLLVFGQSKLPLAFD